VKPFKPFIRAIQIRSQQPVCLMNAQSRNPSLSRCKFLPHHEFTVTPLQCGTKTACALHKR